MSKKTLNLIYAQKEESIVHVSEVSSGLKCGCICPSCGEVLIAQKGSKMQHHFAHSSGNSCEYGYETSLHLAAKEILSDAKRMVLPEVYLNFPDSYKKSELVCESEEIVIDKVLVEHRLDGIVPDVVIYSGDKQYFVEIYVTHAIDSEKIKKIRDIGISTIEINLSNYDGIISKEKLSDMLLKNNSCKKWKYHAKANEIYQKFLDASQELFMESHGFAWHVMECPLMLRIYNGEAYANFIDDCMSCDFCIRHNSDNGGMLCSGAKQLSLISDLDICEEDRVKKYLIEFERKTKLLEEKKCPFCGEALVVKNSYNGWFWGCPNYHTKNCVVSLKYDFEYTIL